jgi:hypothetical protein
LRLNQDTVHDFILLFMPPCGPHLTPLATGSLERSLLASPATIFRACSSHAPTPVKLQPTPAILSQESVHTTLSITHHTRKWPSTGPRTTHGPQGEPPRVTNTSVAFRRESQVLKLWDALAQLLSTQHKDMAWISNLTKIGLGRISLALTYEKQ